MAFEGKTCLVTGGTKGIGEATVEAFAKEKARVFTCSRTQSDLEQKINEWQAKGYDVQGCVCDIAKNEDLDTLIQKVEECFGGKLHVLVNNAGVVLRSTTLELQDDDYETLMDVNVKGPFKLTKLCYPSLKAAGSSGVIFMGSIAGGQTVTLSGPGYSTTKAMIHQLTKNLACEWALDGIRVNCVAPGMILTRMTSMYLNDEKIQKNFTNRTALKRSGHPSEVASVILFLAGNGASFLTGQTLVVDGGSTICGLGY